MDIFLRQPAKPTNFYARRQRFVSVARLPSLFGPCCLATTCMCDLLQMLLRGRGASYTTTCPQENHYKIRTRCLVITWSYCSQSTPAGKDNFFRRDKTASSSSQPLLSDALSIFYLFTVGIKTYRRLNNLCLVGYWMALRRFLTRSCFSSRIPMQIAI